MKMVKKKNGYVCRVTSFWGKLFIVWCSGIVLFLTSAALVIAGNLLFPTFFSFFFVVPLGLGWTHFYITGTSLTKPVLVKK